MLDTTHQHPKSPPLIVGDVVRLTHYSTLTHSLAKLLPVPVWALVTHTGSAAHVGAVVFPEQLTRRDVCAALDIPTSAANRTPDACTVTIMYRVGDKYDNATSTFNYDMLPPEVQVMLMRRMMRGE